MSDPQDKTTLVGIFSMPGEGFVVELGFEGKTALFDKQGLQYRLIQRQQAGMDISTEQSALSQINSYSPVFDA